MKIAYFSEAVIPSPYADAVHSVLMCEALAQKGHQVTLYAPDRQRDYPIADRDVFRFHRVKELFAVRYIPWITIKERAYLYALLAVMRAMKEGNDLFYSRSPLEAIYAALFRRATILEAHTPLSGRINSRMLKLIRNSEHLKRLVVISDALRRHYHEQYAIPLQNIVCARDAANVCVGRREAISEWHGRAGRMQVGYTGALYEDKGIDLIIALAERCSQMDFHLVGGTPGEVAKWRAKSNAENIFYYGMKPPSEVADYLQRFDIVLAPYKERPPIRDGYHDINPWMSSLKLFEYMAAGKAIICSDLPVLREFMRHQDNCLLCPPDDLEAWTAALFRLVHEGALRERLARTAQQEVMGNYTWRRRAGIVLEGLSL